MTPLIVRLPNHLGDACMSIAALDALTHAGYSLTLAGRPWSASLFAGYDWPVIALHDDHRANVRALKQAAATTTTGVLFTNSLSTAVELRVAGISPTGYARGGRSWLLERAVPVHADDHMVQYYYRLAATFIEHAPDVPSALNLRIADAARMRAGMALQQAGVRSPYVVLCPVAAGRHHGKLKSWDGFTRLHDELLARSQCVVAMPGPGEADDVMRVLPNATVLPEGDVGTFAAVLAGSRLVVANDSGPGHLAAAVGARLISIFGVTEPEYTRPWGPRVTMLGSGTGWPRYEDVVEVVAKALAG
jgi:lipopolysaccharide heptosyltransferase II